MKIQSRINKQSSINNVKIVYTFMLNQKKVNNKSEYYKKKKSYLQKNIRS